MQLLSPARMLLDGGGRVRQSWAGKGAGRLVGGATQESARVALRVSCNASEQNGAHHRQNANYFSQAYTPRRDVQPKIGRHEDLPPQNRYRRCTTTRYRLSSKSLIESIVK